ncbi:ParB/RepB/Spo0J family partition protein [Brevundimonas subvibrioides]|uniref:ParB domain protein nuclease n=1 Tax=Brevundimonas subvibrioides (strain ATCC 15264 / DSM 4735 / LMG 14903 / NBRC 16000 / CB 81) TaxID=633149 RepID=D9QIB0_BRESC|nr:ParB/RepB/Spo0J family partition protein [Brevundimonas subvibrioides]ADK99412.1 ParB domain protein nuclease [Brevundimonas subvibrioides ATCC 15264]
MTAAAFEHADLVRRVADREDRPIASMRSLAEELQRDPSNLRKTIKGLADDGVFVWSPGEVPAITDLGRQTLRGIDIAQGLTPANDAIPVPTRWPLDQCRPNPANRPIDPATIPEMAGQIVAAGDILQPCLLTPADANGVRMILAGERRWRGAMMLAQQTDLSGLGIVDGLPFVEREATEVEALKIIMIENSAREDMTPLEDARQLLKLAEASGWSGAELARQTGRSSNGDRNKEKDVTDKLRIAREATPEQIAAYEATGSWDALRNAVFGRATASATSAPSEAEPEAEHDAQWLAERWERATDEIAPPSTRPPESPIPPTLTIYKRGGRYCARVAVTMSDGRIAESRPLPHGMETPALAIQMATDDIVAAMRPTFHRPLIEWLDRKSGPFYVQGRNCLNASNAQERRFALGWDKRQAASGGGSTRTADSAETPALPGTDNTDEARPLSPRARLALIELAHKIGREPRTISPTALAPDILAASNIPEAWTTWGAYCGKYWTDAAFSELVTARLIRAVSVPGGIPPMAVLTADGLAWFEREGLDLMVPHMDLNAAQHAANAIPAAPAVYATDWLETKVAPAAPAPASVDGTQPELLDDPLDRWNRSAADIAADQGLLDRVEAFFQSRDDIDEDAARALMAELKVEGPFTEDGDGGLVATIDGDAASIAFVDVERELPHERSRAIALLACWAMEVVFGSGAAA